MRDCLIAFGSNQGNRQEVFQAAVQSLNQTAGLRVSATSSLLVTAAVGGPAEQAAYLNGAIRVETSLYPHDLHRRLIEIENEFGRTRRTRWGSRSIDLDLLLYGQEQIKTENLIIPHPRMSFRRFVLEPACQIAGDLVHPPSGKTLNQLVSRLNQASDTVLCICVPPFDRIVLSICGEISADPDYSNWSLLPVRSPESFLEQQETAKLVTYVQSAPGDFQASLNPTESNQQLRSAAISFSGPTLELPRDGNQARLELLAAIAAMSPFP